MGRSTGSSFTVGGNGYLFEMASPMITKMSMSKSSRSTFNIEQPSALNQLPTLVLKTNV